MAQFFEGSPAVLNDSAPVRVLSTGTVTFTTAGAETSIAVPEARITTSAVVVLSGIGAVNAAATAFRVDNVVANIGFNVVVNSAATGSNKVVRWAILQY
jgi:imidazoleglycerol phosphate synthase glutamine amidotransferase subunit HisH